MNCCVCGRKLINDIFYTAKCAICCGFACSKCRQLCATNMIQYYKQITGDMTIENIRLCPHRIVSFHVCSKCIPISEII